MLYRLRADLHVHTCLSPCGDLQMSPQKIAEQARMRNIGMLAICDHNSARNIQAVMRAARGAAITVLPGMEVCTREEIHVLGIFEDLGGAFALQSLVYDHLPGQNTPDVLGLQVVANEFDEVVDYEERRLFGASELSLEQVVDEIHRQGGIAIASHIDRETYSVVSQLGFIPETPAFDALELTRHIRDHEALQRFPRCREVAVVRNSDAHQLDDLGVNTSEYLLERPTFGELRKALRREDGRMVCEH
jgi:predicted metal-dependent phosphoesterase TrpH